MICENALISGFALQQRPIGAQVVAEVCRDHAIDLPEAAAAPATGARRDDKSFSFF